MKRNKKGQFIKGTNGSTYEGFGIWYSSKGYPIIWIDGKSIKLHIYVWEKENGSKPKGYQIHHIDNNKKNYLLENLQLVTQSDHFRIHAGWVSEDGEWTKKPCSTCKRKLSLDRFYQRKGHTPSNHCIECSKSNWLKEARKKGIKQKRYIVPNSDGNYECADCGNYKAISEFKLGASGKPQSYCKKCFNIRQKICRKKRNSQS